MIYGISLILLSILAVPSLLLSKRPDAKELLDKITPYQGWIGMVFCFFGLWGILQALFHINIFSTWWITWVAGSTLQAALGFLLGYGLISKYILSKNEDAEKKGAELIANLGPIQGKLGILGLGLGAWMVVLDVLFKIG